MGREACWHWDPATHFLEYFTNGTSVYDCMGERWKSKTIQKEWLCSTTDEKKKSIPLASITLSRLKKKTRDHRSKEKISLLLLIKGVWQCRTYNVLSQTALLTEPVNQVCLLARSQASLNDDDLISCHQPSHDERRTTLLEPRRMLIPWKQLAPMIEKGGAYWSIFCLLETNFIGGYSTSLKVSGGLKKNQELQYLVSLAMMETLSGKSSLLNSVNWYKTTDNFLSTQLSLDFHSRPWFSSQNEYHLLSASKMHTLLVCRGYKYLILKRINILIFSL